MSARGHHIHIVGCLSRSGTTLMKELMVNCFDIDAHSAHEQSIFQETPGRYRVLCTKKPSDIGRIPFPLRVNPKLYVIYMLRDPRDALSSRSYRDNAQHQRVWGNLGDWIGNQTVAQRLEHHPRFITVRYEDLVTAPDAVQSAIAKRMPFLVKKANFSDFHKLVRPTEESSAALGEIRPISPASVGNWRSQLPYIKAQHMKYGDISKWLISLGYEKNNDWLGMFEGVMPDNADEKIKRHSFLHKAWLKAFTKPRRNLMYLMAHMPGLGNVVTLLRFRVRGWLNGRKAKVAVSK